MKFKVGDRVRIACPASNMNGRQATVWRIARPPTRKWHTDAIAAGCRWWHAVYYLDVDGIGARERTGFFGFAHFMLRPATDPRASQFVADMERFASVMKARVFPLPSDVYGRIRGGSQ